ncbi:VCBS domain-containing protein [Catenovulum agarivorans]|uniref:VCBS domain-containing protein n=1 Tax=Catenovulum agarivorans TaxID=1172192 RepID=UPI0002FDE7DC|nr:VCBS domain-containing protein [Catenovulum agarivorans]
MKKQFLTLSIIAALTACSSDDDTNTNQEQVPAELSGDFSATATKALDPTGTVVVNDSNKGESMIFPVAHVGAYGSFSINAAGEWVYTLDKKNADIVALVSSDMPSLTETPFSFRTVDGVTSSVAITIDGIDVPATFRDGLTFSIFNDDDSASATVKVADANPAEAFFAPEQTPTAMYGAVTFDTTTGKWTFNIDETNLDVQALDYVEALPAGQQPPTLVDTFTISSLDGTEQVITITIKGSQLIPATFAGELTSTITTNDGSATKIVTVSDTRPADAFFAPNQTPTATYGSVSFDSDKGEWTYTIDQSNADVAALNYTTATDQPPSLADSFVIESLDGTQATIAITIEGSQFVPAVVSGLPVDDNGDSTAITNVNSAELTGTLTVTDPNFGQARFQTQSATVTTYGTFSIDENGAWVYQVDKTNAEVLALTGTSTPLTELIKVTTIDGTAADVPITIAGLAGGNLAAQIGGGADLASFSVKFPSQQATGKISFNAYLDANTLKDVDMVLWGNNYHSSDIYRSVQVMAAKADGTFDMRSSTCQDPSDSDVNCPKKATDDFQLSTTDGNINVGGKWFNVELTWDGSSAAKGVPYQMTLSIDGAPVRGTEITTDVFDAHGLITSGLVTRDGSNFFEFRVNKDANASFYVDDLKVFSDVAGTTAVISEDFDTLAEGSDLSTNAISDDSRTTGTTVGQIDKP